MKKMNLLPNCKVQKLPNRKAATPGTCATASCVQHRRGPRNPRRCDVGEWERMAQERHHIPATINSSLSRVYLGF